MDNFRSFDYFRGQRKVLTFAEALNSHNMMKEPVKAYLEKAGIRRAIDCDVLVELWDGLMGVVSEEDAKTCIPLCVDGTMPVHYTNIIRKRAGTAAAFAFCEITKVLTGLDDVTDDFEVRRVMKLAWLAFEKRDQEANTIQDGYGCGTGASWMTMRDIGTGPKSQRFMDKMMSIAALAGRMFESFGYHHKTHPNDSPEEVTGATTGSNIERIMSDEIALLGDDDLKESQTMKILEGKANIREMKGVEEKNRGPLVLVIDESGSMHDGDLGDHIWSGCKLWNGRNTWAKACAIALTRIAWSEDRPVRVVHFGDSTEVQEIPKDDHRALFEMSRCFLSGGTSFGTALKRGRKVVGDLAADGFEGADIVLITDGDDWDHKFHNREIDHMDAANIRLWTIAIGEALDANVPVVRRAEKYTYAPDRELGNYQTAIKLAQGLDKAALGNNPGAGGMTN